MNYYSRQLCHTGISQQAFSFKLSLRKKGSLSNYQLSRKKWSRWCTIEEIDTFRCPINDVINLLADCFSEGYEYRTIRCFRSSISAYRTRIGGKPVRQHALVHSLMTGILNERTSKPRHLLVCSVESVYQSENLSHKHLTCRVTMLMALTSISRASSPIHYLENSFMLRTSHEYISTFTNYIKDGEKVPPLLD